MSFIRIDINSTYECLGGYDENDSWSRDSSSGDAEVVGVSVADKRAYDVWETKEEITNGDTVYIVLAVYGTGDSFGSDGGQSEVFLVTKDEQKAKDKIKYLEGVTDYSVPWNGYFEWLQEIKLSTHVVS
jgi:hypothetical protein